MGLTRPRAAQIFNLDYKQATRAVTTTNITLTGGAPAVVDGVTLANNDRVLVTGQSNAVQNGIYTVTTAGSGSNGTWVLSYDDNTTGEVDAGMIVMVTEGTVYADTQWKLTTDNPIVIGTTALTFVQNYFANSINGGTSNVTVINSANVIISSAGTANVLTISSTGTVTKGTQSVTANVTAGNILTAGLISATGNVTGNYIIGNGSQLTGLPAGYANSTAVAYGEAGWAGNIVPSANVTYTLGNVNNQWKTLYVSGNTIYIGGTALSSSGNALSFNGNAVVTANATGTSTTSGNVSITGNITGGNMLTGGLISATGTIIGNQFTGSGAGLTSIPGANVTGTVTTATTATYVTGLTSSNVTTALGFTPYNSTNPSGYQTTSGYVAQVSGATQSNITTVGSSLTTSGTVYAATVNATTIGNTGAVHNGTTVSVTGTVTAASVVGGVITGSSVSVTGAVTGSSFTGSGSGLTSIPGANVTGTVATATTATYVTGLTSSNVTTALGFTPYNSTNPSGYQTTSGYVATVSGAAQGNITSVGTLSSLSVSGNVSTSGLNQIYNASGANYNEGIRTPRGGSNYVCYALACDTSGGGSISGQFNILVYPSNVNGTITGAGNGQFVIRANGTDAFAISTGGGVYATTFNGKATSAQYADLAEVYTADATYPPGTVVSFGGIREITISSISHATQVAGIVSTNPAYLMNSALSGDHTVEVALTGRVPCRVVGTIAKGDRLVASDIPGVATSLELSKYQPGCIVAKALECYDSDQVGVIEVAVGRT